MKEIVFEIKQTGSQTILMLNELANVTLKRLAKEFACTFRYVIKSNAKGLPVIHVRAISSNIALNETIALHPDSIQDLIKRLDSYVQADDKSDLEKMTKQEIADKYDIPNEGTKKDMIEKILNG